MGMDVYGKKPTSKEGEYFRNNIWWWPALATFVQVTYPEIAKECEHWHSNDGDGLGAEGAAKLGEALRGDLDSGLVREYERAYKVLQEQAEDDPCWSCEGSGARVVSGTETQECWLCKGSGKVESSVRRSPFSEENVREFAAFVAASGGFEIW